MEKYIRYNLFNVHIFAFDLYYVWSQPGHTRCRSSQPETADGANSATIPIKH